MIPLGDASRRPNSFPGVTFALIGVNAIVFIVELMKGDQFVLQWSVTPADISAGRDLITIVTAMFLHASWSHILGNMVFLYAFGPEIEDAMGSGRYAVFYLVGGTIAMLTQVAFDPHSAVPNLGASGAIASVMGAFIVTYPRDQIRTLIFLWVFIRVTLVSAWLLIGIWFVIQLFDVGMVANVETGGVAYLAHVGGFAFGAIFGRLFEDRRRLADSETARPL
jgi:rhomboid family protein